MSPVINNSINAPLPLSPSLGGSGISSPTINQVPIANGSDPFNLVQLYEGQFLVGTSGAPTAGDLVAGNGISLSYSSPNVTITCVGAFRRVVYFKTAGSGTYTPLSGIKRLYAIVIGAGGGGGGAGANAAGSGGGAGGYAAVLLSAAASYSYTVGAGGAGGNAGGNNSGSTGGTSSLGSVAVANGGGGGTGANAITAGNGGVSGQPGLGGNGVTGDLLIDGGGGGVGITIPTGVSTSIAVPGFGGTSAYSGNYISVPTFGGGNGSLYGGGGAGGGSNNAGNGANGLIIIYEYY